jgi:hypothetical protein
MPIPTNTDAELGRFLAVSYQPHTCSLFSHLALNLIQRRLKSLFSEQSNAEHHRERAEAHQLWYALVIRAPLRTDILPLDGGGARVLSQLQILETAMHRIQYDHYPDDPDAVVLPCECFDMMGGSDMGGWVRHLLIVEDAYFS